MPVASPQSAPQIEMSLRDLKRTLVAKRNWIIGPTLVALMASTAFVNIVKPLYTAEARVLLEFQNSFMPVAEKTQEAPATLDPEAVGSQVELIKSRDIARRAIKSLGLLGNSEFDPQARGIGVLSRIGQILGLKPDLSSLSPEDRVFERFFERLTVYSPLKTRVLVVEFQSHDPELAAKGANAIAGIYIDYQQESKRQVAHVAAESLAKLVAELKMRVATAETKAEDFRTQSGLLIGANNVTINSQQLGEVNAELSRALTSQADSQAKARLIRDLLKKGRIYEIPDVANNETVRRVSEQIITTKAQIALESRTLLSGHPRIKELNAQLVDLESALRAAADKSARTLESEAQIAGSRVEILRDSLNQQKKVVGESSADEVQMRELDRSARLLKDELEATTTKYQEALAQENSNATPADARIISPALAPPLPSFPKKTPIIVFSTLAALFLSAGLVIMRQLLSDNQNLRRSSMSTGDESQDLEDDGAVATIHDVKAARKAPLKRLRPEPMLVAAFSAPEATSNALEEMPDAAKIIPDISEKKFDTSKEASEISKKMSHASKSASDMAKAMSDELKAASGMSEQISDTSKAMSDAQKIPTQPPSVARTIGATKDDLTARVSSIGDLLNNHSLARTAKIDNKSNVVATADEAQNVENRPQNTKAPYTKEQAVPQESQFTTAQILAKQISSNGVGAKTLSLLVRQDRDDAGFALAVARILASEGRSILISMDGAVVLPIASEIGLSNLTIGETNFHRAIQRDPASRLHIVAPGDKPSINTQGLLVTLDALLGAYDFVVVAAPPTLDVAEMQALSHLTSVVAVVGEDVGQSQKIAQALTDCGLPDAFFIPTHDVRADQTAA